MLWTLVKDCLASFVVTLVDDVLFINSLVFCKRIAFCFGKLHVLINRLNLFIRHDLLMISALKILFFALILSILCWRFLIDICIFVRQILFTI